MAEVLAAPLMDVSRIMDTAKLSPTGSNSNQPPVNTPSVDAAMLATVAGPTPSRPSTPELIALGPSKPRMMPDLQKLFTLYYHDPTKSPELKVATASATI